MNKAEPCSWASHLALCKILSVSEEILSATLATTLCCSCAKSNVTGSPFDLNEKNSNWYCVIDARTRSPNCFVEVVIDLRY